MILVTGATGTIGSAVVAELCRRGEPVRAMTRSRTPDAVPQGAQQVFGDFGVPSSLVAASAGVSALFLLSPPGPSAPENDGAMLGAARSAGVARVVKISAIGTADRDGAAVRAWHGPGERSLAESGLSWTVLRPSDLATNTLRWARAIRAGRPVPNPTGSGARGVIDPLDVAAVAVEVLISGGHDAQTYTLTGSELLTVHDQVQTIGDVLGSRLSVAAQSLDDLREQLRAAGRDQAFIDVALDGARFVRDGGAAVITDHVERVLGRRPRSFRRWTVEHRRDFQ